MTVLRASICLAVNLITDKSPAKRNGQLTGRSQLLNLEPGQLTGRSQLLNLEPAGRP